MTESNPQTFRPLPTANPETSYRVSRQLQQRGKELLFAPDLVRRLPRLDPLEVFFIVKELGLHDSLPILLGATRTQLRTFVDLDCWASSGEDTANLAPDLSELDTWLSPFAELGAEALALAFSSLDDELQALFITATVAIFEHPGEDGDPPDAPPSMTLIATPDNVFMIGDRTAESTPAPFRNELDLDIEPVALAMALYKAAPCETRRLMSVARFETVSVLTEEAHHFREARLLDLGFPAAEVALELFTAPPQQPVSRIKRPPGHFRRLPTLYTESLASAEPGLFEMALQSIDDRELLAEVGTDLVYLTNAAVIGYGESPRDLAHAQEIATRVRDTLSLGLESLLFGDGPVEYTDATTSAAVAAMAAQPLQLVFRHGIAATLELSADARRLLADPVVTTWADDAARADDDATFAADRAFLVALAAKRPLLAGWDLFNPSSCRALSSVADLHAAEQRLSTLADDLL